MTENDQGGLSIRHVLATIAYRGAKVLRDAPDGFSDFRAGDGSRTAGQILAHLCDLFDWALSIASGDQRWSNSIAGAWSYDVGRFFAAVTALDAYLQSGATLHVPAGRLFQGALADSLTHIGQLGMLRRLAGAPVLGENYFVANIEVGRTGLEQSSPVREFG